MEKTNRLARFRGFIICFLGSMLILNSGCQRQNEVTSHDDAKRAVISITSDPKVDPQSVNMGLTFAGFCADEGYEVSIFFNVKGVLLPTQAFDSKFRFGEHAPMLEQLQSLHARGVQLHVCPVCMKDLSIAADAIIDEAFVTDKPKLFGRLGGDTMVFSY